MSAMKMGTLGNHCFRPLVKQVLWVSFMLPHRSTRHIAVSHPARRCGPIRGCFRGIFFSLYGEDLPHRAKTVYMYLKDRSNREGQCYPAIGTIARELQLSRRTVERAIADLERAGFLEKEQRWRENGGRSSLLYTLK